MSNRTEHADLSEGVGSDNRDVEKLVLLAQDGDMGAFDELVREFQRPMFNLAYRMVNNREDAADLTQEIFVKLHKSIGKFQGRSKFSTWLYTLASNTCRSGLRRLIRVSKREGVSLDQEIDGEEGTMRRDTADPGDQPGRELERKEVISRIEDFITELPEEFRIVVVLRDMQGLAYEEIAKTLECSVGTVKSRLSRARVKLKDKLIREGLTCAVQT